MRPMRAVARFEVHLLRVLHALLQRAPIEPAVATLARPLDRPRCLSRDAVELIQDTLAKGCVRFLARRGWMRDRFLRDGKIAEGRLWERTPATELGLTFSKHSLELLVQLQAGTLGNGPSPKEGELTVGDRLLFFLAYDALRDHAPGQAMRKHWTPLYQDGLCRLAFPEELVDQPERFRIDWLPWTTGIGASILETLQGWLAERWTAVERKKESLSSVPRVRRLGANQQRVYGEYLDALVLHDRRDLARCFLTATQTLLRDRPTARKWVRNLDLSAARLADRPTIYRDAFAFLSQLPRLQAWQQQAVGVGYFDEGYAASQLWKADWERYRGDELCERACAIQREMEPMKS